jgi:hypothetical protein
LAGPITKRKKRDKMNSKVIDLRSIVTLTDAQKENLPCGAIVFWELSGDTTVEQLSRALDDAQSVALKPEAPSVKVASVRACEIVARKHNLKTQPITRTEQAKSRTRATGGIALSRPLAVRADGNLGTLNGPIVAIYRAAQSGSREVSQADGSLKTERYTTPACFDGEPEMVAELSSALEDALKVLTPTDVSSWLCNRIEALGGFPLKSNGGTYFVPPEALAKYKTLREAVQSVTKHRMGLIPAMKGSDAVEAILMALETNTTSAIAQISAAIETGTLGERALATKQAELDDLLERLTRYEGLLGKKLDTVREKIEEATAAAAIAMLTASAKEEP